MNRFRRVKTFCVTLILVAGCSGEPQATSNTIPTADPRPAPATSTGASRPALATAGSPPPAEVVAPGTAFVTVRSGQLDVQRLLPRAHTVFHVANETDVAHDLVMRGAVAGRAGASLPPNGKAVIALLLGAGAYDVICTTPGHQERARFETYEPGVPLDIDRDDPVRR